jgi:TetR/AcrR family transcriptional repressor of nem operon
MTAIINGVKFFFERVMKVTRQQAAENRNRVLNLASRRFRERGFHGLGVADLMHEAGLTHGGFYKQFKSKEDLIAQACALAIGENLAGYQQFATQNKRSAFKSVARGMLSVGHRDARAEGCVLAALGPDISRAGPSTRHEVTKGIKTIVDCLGGLIPGKSRKRIREKSLSTYATIVGALVLARAVDEPELSEKVLKSALRSITTST